MKTNFFCPAKINAKIFNDESVHVTFVSTHVGHDCHVGHLRLAEPEKNLIAGLINVGVPQQLILQKIAENASPTKQLALTRPQDIRNIAAS